MQENKIETNKQTKKELLLEIFRFLIVGGIATIVDYAIFYLFRKWILPPSLIGGKVWDNTSLTIATGLGFCFGLLINWLLSISFVFKQLEDKEKSTSGKSFLIFTIIGLIGLGVTELGVLLLVNLFPTIKIFNTVTFLNLAWKEWVAKVIMTLIVLVWNYLGRKLIIFK